MRRNRICPIGSAGISVSAFASAVIEPDGVEMLVLKVASSDGSMIVASE